MEKRDVDLSVERRVLIAMITNADLLGRLAGRVTAESFGSDFGQLVSDWALKYYEHHRTAPGRHIEDLFHAWSRKTSNKALVENVSSFLSSLSGEFDNAGLNVEYLIEQAEVHFNAVKLSHLAEDLELNVAHGLIVEATAAVREFGMVQISTTQGIDPLRDEDRVRRAFEEQSEDLFTLPGCAGEFFRGQLVRDGFVAFQAPEKRGKTWWQIEMAFRAMRGRRRVAFFEVGDMSEHQMIRRIHTRLSGLPDRASQCGAVKIPRKITREIDPEEGHEITEVDYETRKIEKPITWREGIRVARRFQEKVVKSPDRTVLKLSTHPNSSINVSGIESQLDEWERSENFIPDVIIIDYADILAPENPRMDFRHQVNETWKALRRLSQERHALVITATQANAESYNAHTQSMRNFSEDKRKLAHVTGMVGLNQSDVEKERGIMRLNWLVLREGEFHSRRCVYVGQCLTIGRPLCTSA